MKKVLLIDDSDFNRKIVEVILSSRGYELLQAKDAKQGLEMAKKHKPDLILMDIQLPGMDGYQATRILKSDETTRDIPVIALTANAMPQHTEKAREAGCDGYITKPFDTRSLPGLIDKFILGKEEIEDEQDISSR